MFSFSEYEQHLKAIFNASTDSIWTFSLDGLILAVNEAAAKRLKKNVSDLIGKKWQSFVSPQLMISRMKMVELMVQKGEPVSFEDERDGIIFNHCYYPVKNENNKISSFVSYSCDITEKKRADSLLVHQTKVLRNINTILTEAIKCKSEKEFGRFVCSLR